MDRVPTIPRASQIKYLVRRHAELPVMRSALATGDLHALETMGHKWRGNAETFGYPELGSLGSRLEESAQAAQFAEVFLVVSQFEKWLVEHPVPDAPLSP